MFYEDGKKQLSGFLEAVRLAGERIAADEDLTEELKNELVQVMARHGDSLTHLKPDEYFNIIMIESDTDFVWDGSSSTARGEILSVKMSEILAHRSGETDLSEFRTKVLEY